jgi:hypothetical protein
MNVELFTRLRGHVLHHGYRVWQKWKPWVDIGEGAGSAVLVAGSGRSGTTWVGNVIAEMTHTRPMFEPFLLTPTLRFVETDKRSHSDEGVEFSSSLYGSPDRPLDPYHHDGITQILSGRVRSAWIDRATKPAVYRGRTIKDIRANMLLGYIARHWPELKMVWLVRDPRDVIDSQLAARGPGWYFDWSLEVMLQQESLRRDWFCRLDTQWLRETTGSVVGRLAHRWCLENAVPAAQGIAHCKAALRVDYDALCTSEMLWNEIASHVSGKIWDSSKLRIVASRRSSTSRSGSERARTKWVRWSYLSEADCHTINAIVRIYEETFLVKLLS